MLLTLLYSGNSKLEGYALLVLLLLAVAGIVCILWLLVKLFRSDNSVAQGWGVFLLAVLAVVFLYLAGPVGLGVVATK